MRSTSSRCSAGSTTAAARCGSRHTSPSASEPSTGSPTSSAPSSTASRPRRRSPSGRSLARVTSSLDAPVGDSETTLGELRAQSDGRSDDEVIDREREEAVSTALATLPEGERRVLEVRFGTGGEVAGTLRDAARAAGVTQEQARRLEAQGLKRLAADESLAGWREAA